MGLFDVISTAIDNPELQASTGQVGGLLSVVSQLSGNNNLDASTTQSLLSVVGKHARSALQEKRSELGAEGVSSLVEQLSGSEPNENAVSMLFSPDRAQQTAQEASEKTGLDLSAIQQMLPALLPVVLNFLQTGKSNEGQSNPVLDAFLDADGDGDTDMGDMLSMASRFLG